MNEIKNIQITDLVSAPDNPFKVTMDAEMERLIESIAETGVIAPIIARPTNNGKFEIVSGHRRKYACEYLGIKSVPTIIKELDRNEAVIFLVDSNYSENILPSEKAFAYKMKLDALSAQGKRTDLTSCQLGTKLRSDELMAQTAEDSARQIQRYIRLTNLIPPILDMVDEKRIALTPAVELSYLLPEEQTMLLSEMEYNDCTPNLSQAQRIKGLSMQGLFTKERLSIIMSEEKANQKERVKIPAERIRKYFPKDYTIAQIEETIVKLCEAYHRKRLCDRDTR
ncbi:MAG: ParB/RepB/Spo0J family partition protein [Acutalibacteraceae bacterium]